MTTFPGSPRFLKGALVGVDLLDPNPSVIVFQYNPGTLTRSLKSRAMSGEGAKSEATRLTDAPEETIRVGVRIDATDQHEQEQTPATMERHSREHLPWLSQSARRHQCGRRLVEPLARAIAFQYTRNPRAWLEARSIGSSEDNYRMEDV